MAQTLASLRSQRPFEIIVVDGGSIDRTLEVARDADKVISGTRGRAAQMNLGAEQARGDMLVFLHADCQLENGAIDAVERCLNRRHVVAGCFRMQVRAQGLLYRSIDFCATARVKLTGIIYGDQGMFISRELFRRVGGFPNLCLMEDLFFSRNLRRHGRIVVAPSRIFVSPRRWQQAGLIRQSLRNWMLTAAVAAGIHPDSLARFYPIAR